MMTNTRIAARTSGIALERDVIDGITELWFDDVESIATVFAAPAYLELIRPDEAIFALPGCEFIVSTEHPVYPRGR